MNHMEWLENESEFEWVEIEGWYMSEELKGIESNYQLFAVKEWMKMWMTLQGVGIDSDMRIDRTVPNPLKWSHNRHHPHNSHYQLNKYGMYDMCFPFDSNSN